MKNIVFHILVSVGAAFLLAQLQEIVGSRYLTDFLMKNLITIILTLMAINAATVGIVLGKIRDLSDISDGDFFQKSKKQMRISITEQITLVIISVVFFIILT